MFRDMEVVVCAESVADGGGLDQAVVMDLLPLFVYILVDCGMDWKLLLPKSSDGRWMAI